MKFTKLQKELNDEGYELPVDPNIIYMVNWENKSQFDWQYYIPTAYIHQWDDLALDARVALYVMASRMAENCENDPRWDI